MGLKKPNLELTTVEKEIIAFHAAYTKRYGAPPTLRAMARHFEVFPNAIRYHLKNLVEKGHIKEKEPRPVTGKFVLSAKGRNAAS